MSRTAREIEALEENCLTTLEQVASNMEALEKRIKALEESIAPGDPTETESRAYLDDLKVCGNCGWWKDQHGGTCFAGDLPLCSIKAHYPACESGGWKPKERKDG